MQRKRAHLPGSRAVALLLLRTVQRYSVRFNRLRRYAPVGGGASAWLSAPSRWSGAARYDGRAQRRNGNFPRSRVEFLRVLSGQSGPQDSPALLPAFYPGGELPRWRGFRKRVQHCNAVVWYGRAADPPFFYWCANLCTLDFLLRRSCLTFAATISSQSKVSPRAHDCFWHILM